MLMCDQRGVHRRVRKKRTFPSLGTAAQVTTLKCGARGGRVPFVVTFDACAFFSHQTGKISTSLGNYTQVAGFCIRWQACRRAADQPGRMERECARVGVHAGAQQCLLDGACLFVLTPVLGIFVFWLTVVGTELGARLPSRTRHASDGSPPHAS